jgi:hypothetical protein
MIWVRETWPLCGSAADRAQDMDSGVSTRPGLLSCLTCLIIRLIIQTIRRVPSGPDATDEPPNLSRADPSGADQIDAEHQATDLAVEGWGD